MRARQDTLSSAVSSQARIGSGTTELTNTWKGLASHPRNIIPSTNPCLDQPDGSPPTGKNSWWDRDDAMGRDRLGGFGSPPGADGRTRASPSRAETAEVQAAGMNPVATSTSSPGTTQASEGRLEAPKTVAALIGHHPYGKLALVA
jgi:hypothetical protein